MEFGKVDSALLSDIDLRLFDDDPRSWNQLARHGQNSANGSTHLQLRLGCPTWGAKNWLGKVYPQGTKSSEFLRQYSRQFATIELNATHYGIPEPATIGRWRDSTPTDFRFCPKVPQDISHSRALSQNSVLTREFIHRVLGLEHRLGMSFLQLPPHFAPQDLDELRKFLRQIPKGFELAVEVRHPGFFNDHTLIAPLFDLLASTGTHAVTLDVAGRRDVLHLSLPTAKSMVRFIGNSLHPSDETRLRQWSERIVSWRKLGLQEMYLFLHQPDDLLAPETMTLMTNMLNEAFAKDLPHALEKPVPLWVPVNSSAQSETDRMGGSIGDENEGKKSSGSKKHAGQLGFKID